MTGPRSASCRSPRARTADPHPSAIPLHASPTSGPAGQLSVAPPYNQTLSFPPRRHSLNSPFDFPCSTLTANLRLSVAGSRPHFNVPTVADTPTLITDPHYPHRSAIRGARSRRTSLLVYDLALPLRSVAGTICDLTSGEIRCDSTAPIATRHSGYTGRSRNVRSLVNRSTSLAI